LGAGLQGSAAVSGAVSTVGTVGPAFAQPVIVFFTLFGALAGCLVTRTYLTGALGRADRTTVGAFTNAGLSFSEALLLLRHQRSLGSRGQGQLSPEVERVAAKLAGLSIEDLRTPQEFALWAKAKSASATTPVERKQALDGYAKAIALCECDPALALDYAVALHAAGEDQGALQQLEQAYLHLSAATAPETRKNIYKSLTYSLLYLQPPQSFERTLKIIEQFEKERTEGKVPESGSVRVNEACAHGIKFKWIAESKGLAAKPPGQPYQVNLPADHEAWPADLKAAFTAAHDAIVRALAVDPAWVARFQLLLLHNHRDKTPGSRFASFDDLEIFERFNEFRDLLGLPQWTPAAAVDEQELPDEELEEAAPDNAAQAHQDAVEGERLPIPVAAQPAEAIFEEPAAQVPKPPADGANLGEQEPPK
jgi:hypothetical protein